MVDPDITPMVFLKETPTVDTVVHTIKINLALMQAVTDIQIVVVVVVLNPCINKGIEQLRIIMLLTLWVVVAEAAPIRLNDPFPTNPVIVGDSAYVPVETLIVTI